MLILMGEIFDRIELLAWTAGAAFWKQLCFTWMHWQRGREVHWQSTSTGRALARAVHWQRSISSALAEEEREDRAKRLTYQHA